MGNLEILTASGNPLRIPPTVDVHSFLKSAMEGDAITNLKKKLKVVFLGHGGTGKTTVCIQSCFYATKQKEI